MSDAEQNIPRPEILAESETDEKLRASRDSQATVTFPVVGVGASAGGLDACIELLKATDTQLGIGFVLVPHLEPTHESAMTELLSRATAMPVLQVEHGMKVKPDHVYVIPPGKEMVIREGILHLAPRRQKGSMPIDMFFRSLAEDCRHNAVGIVLSGTASDGTLGLSAIKGEGGITFAQDSQSAKYDGMPSSAIASGAVDFVLSPADIAEELKRIRRHPYVSEGHDAVAILGHEGSALEQLFRVLKQATRVDFSDYKPATIRRRILRRMAVNKIKNLRDYVALLREQPVELDLLFQDILINVTSLFRNPDAFEALKRCVYPALFKDRSPNDTVRIWVPGCSTGEEVFSHAISLVEYLTDVRIDVSIQVFGTDLSETAIQRARSGIFRENISADVTPTRLRRFFSKVEGGYQISKSIRDVCIFARQNVFSDPPFSRMDIVSCRNLLIYLGPVLQKRVIPVFHYALRSDGFLMLGSTEGLLGAGHELFDLIDKKNKIYCRRPGASPVNFGFTMNRTDATYSTPQPDLGKKQETPQPAADLQREADRLLLAKYVPAAVVINSQLDILQSRGQASRYLELSPGKASLNLLRMARPGLLFELQRAVDEVAKTNKPVTRDNIQVETSGNRRLLSIEVIPFSVGSSSERHFLVVFHDEAVIGSGTPGHDQGQNAHGDQGKDAHFEQLKEELAAAKEYLQSIIEEREATNQELQAANEEIQSGNEELQSTNEELQTSKEELESANEELNTVNEEMQHRNQQLTLLNNDLTNLLNSVNMPIVMLGPDLGIRRFTMQAEKLLGLSSVDIGRPINKVRMRANISDLEHAVLGVIRDVHPAQLEFRDDDGVAYDLRISPYRTADNKIDGAVLVCLDSRALKASRSQQRKSEQRK